MVFINLNFHTSIALLNIVQIFNINWIVCSPTATTLTEETTARTYAPQISQGTSGRRRSRLINEYSQPVIETNDDETALSLIASSNILSMDDTSVRVNRGLTG